jgi:hypothetical protein
MFRFQAQNYKFPDKASWFEADSRRKKKEEEEEEEEEEADRISL